MADGGAPHGTQAPRPAQAPPAAAQPRAKVSPFALLNHFERVIVGKREPLTLMLAALLADGHVLIEDVPGVAKTIAARTLARSFSLRFGRIQMTPDLLPADLTGSSVFDNKRDEFVFRPGPVFAQLLLVDELNRATPRTQAGLLEAMEERAVTADGKRYRLPKPFFVIATQNPIEQSGVFPLPEAQLDRFLIQVSMGYPTSEDETAIVAAQSNSHPIDTLAPVLDVEAIMELRLAAASIFVDPSVTDYIVRLVRETRNRPDVALGASPRASIGLHHIARAYALIQGSPFVRPDHVKAVAPAVLRHRIQLTPQARLSGTTSDEIIESILESVEVPLHVGVS